jgi:hypothetical protein
MFSFGIPSCPSIAFHTNDEFAHKRITKNRAYRFGMHEVTQGECRSIEGRGSV